MATMANHDRESTLPICQNCSTSTTPLWRRDEMGSVLCNACGLFLKLHGRPRPISLKTDVIKSRNRVKTSLRPDVAMKKKNNAAAHAAAVMGDPNSVVDLQGHAYAATAALSARRVSHKGANGHLDGHDSPMSGAGTPGLYSAHAAAGYTMIDDGQYPGAPLAFAATGDTPGRTDSPSNGDRMDLPQTQEQLAAANSSLKTRVAELEVINDFIQRRLGHYDSIYGSGAGAVAVQEPQPDAAAAQQQQQQNQESDAQLRAQVELLTQSETQLRTQIDEGSRRENMLKRRLDELEQELKETKEALCAYDSGRAKKPRLDLPTASAEATAADAAGATGAAAETNAAKESADDKSEAPAAPPARSEETSVAQDVAKAAVAAVDAPSQQAPAAAEAAGPQEAAPSQPDAPASPKA